MVELHPDDAARLGIADGALARVATPQGESIFRARHSEGQRPGELFVPIHWTDRQSTGGRAGLLPRDLVDPVSGQPGFKLSPARIEPIETDWRGFLVIQGTARRPDCLWATEIPVPDGVLYELAGVGEPDIEQALPPGERIEARDPARGTRRVAVLREGRLAAALFVTRSGELPGRDWLVAQLGLEQGPQVLAGRAPGEQADRGPVVCACFDVGLATIVATIRDQSLTDVSAIGAALRAGTNCGSCRPALARILRDHPPARVPAEAL
jgi:assimilatory nitrate reductase catalytic subunit